MRVSTAVPPPFPTAPPPLPLAARAARTLVSGDIGMSDCQYCWIVICKNHKFHRQRNLFSGHRILLGETDAFTPHPPIDRPLNVRCDDCGKEYTYRPSEVLRYQIDLPASFAPHPLFS